MNNIAYNLDCLEAMKGMEDKAFDLAIVDPPYGIGFGEFNRTNKTANGVRHKANKYKNSKWDTSVPADEYFIELKRVSTHQIIWGGNYFEYLCGVSPKMKTIEEFIEFMHNSSENWIFWHKQNPVPNFADGELAWCSFETDQIIYNYRYYGGLEGITSASKKHHPTQKPIQLYKWLLNEYAPIGTTILDTHLGSGSSRIAAFEMGFDFTGYELDPEYFQAQEKRYA